MTSEERKAAGKRLQQARILAGHRRATDVVDLIKPLEYSTYAGHENGSRGFSQHAARYAKLYNVDLGWLLTGLGEMTPHRVDPRLAQIWQDIPAENRELALRALQAFVQRDGTNG